MDGPSTNWKFLDLLSKLRVDHQFPKLVNIGSCSLHISHGAFKTGSEKSGWEIKPVLKGSFQFLHDTPARREDFISVTGCSVFPLFFCATRWIEDSDVAKRLISIWENIVKIIRFYEKMLKSKQPSSKSFLNVQQAVNDKLIVAKL